MDKYTVVDFLSSKDGHIGSLIIWIGTFESILNDIKESDLDSELGNDVEEIIGKLRDECGKRILEVLIG